MAAERHAPDGLLVQTNLSGSLTDIDEDPDAGDGAWLTAASNNSDSDCAVSFPTPTGNPTAGAGLQEFRWLARLTPNGSSCAWNAYLRESGVRLNGGAAIASGTLTSTTGQVLSATWDAALLGTANGSLVEAELVVTKSGGSPSARTTGEIGAVEWNAEYSAATPFQADLSAASFGMSPQAVTRLNAWRGDLSSAGFGFMAQSVTRLSAWLGEISTASFSIAGQPVSFSGVANYVADLTAASFSMAGQALGRFSDYRAQLSAASMGFAAQALTWFQDTRIELSAAAMDFVGRSLTWSSGAMQYVRKAGRGLLQNVGRMMNR